ncbi:MAG: GAF domain-containing protein [Gemmatimonadota bacterium]|nr:GAF domain-containing protein [Gemmatimonadota bacterium]MDH3428347.1 GAF domain-containing protein [Gemmatimonadota bacterium]
MLDGSRIVSRLDTESRDGADRDALLRLAVQEIEAASGRFDWVGIYLLDGETLTLHNYVGEPTEHTQITVGHGVCGTAVAEDRNINVPDVRALDNYIACSVETRSEIVVLIRAAETGQVYGQLDLDSDRQGAFTEADEIELRRVADWLGGLFSGD